MLEARSALQDVVRGDGGAESLAPFVSGVRYEALLIGAGVTWTLDLPEGRSAAALAVLTWDTVRVSSPGRLRPCANPECRRFLIDHSKPNSARWCSMAICGNRMKARRHYQRRRRTLVDRRDEAITTARLLAPNVGMPKDMPWQRRTVHTGKAHLTIVFAALAVSRWIEPRAGRPASSSRPPAVTARSRSRPAPTPSSPHRGRAWP